MNGKRKIILKSLIFLILFYLTYDFYIKEKTASTENPKETQFEKYLKWKLINPYVNQEDTTRIKLFQKLIKKAMEKPSILQWINVIFTDGLNGVAYTELPDSFVAYTTLHQTLHRYINKQYKSNESIPDHIRKDYLTLFNHFRLQLNNLDHFTSSETYIDALHSLYKNFLVNFMTKHFDFFEKRCWKTLDSVQDTKGKELDNINRAFFALKKEWPSYEKNDHKYQFEKIYAYRCNNGKLLIVGFNDQEYVCQALLNVYILDTNSQSEKNSCKKLTIKELEFDLSPYPRSGGCSFKLEKSILNYINFDGRFLKFSGYNYQDYRNYMCDVENLSCFEQ